MKSLVRCSAASVFAGHRLYIYRRCNAVTSWRPSRVSTQACLSTVRPSYRCCSRLQLLSVRHNLQSLKYRLNFWPDVVRDVLMLGNTAAITPLGEVQEYQLYVVCYKADRLPLNNWQWSTNTVSVLRWLVNLSHQQPSNRTCRQRQD